MTFLTTLYEDVIEKHRAFRVVGLKEGALRAADYLKTLCIV